MKGDPGSTYHLDATDVSATGATASSMVIDHSIYPCASYYIATKSVGTSFDAKVQMSDDNSTWVDEDGASGNDTAITQQTGADEDQLNVPNPQKRYSKVLCTAVGAVVSFCFVVAGPERHNAAA